MNLMIDRFYWVEMTMRINNNNSRHVQAQFTSFQVMERENREPRRSISGNGWTDDLLISIILSRVICATQIDSNYFIEMESYLQLIYTLSQCGAAIRNYTRDTKLKIKSKDKN